MEDYTLSPEEQEEQAEYADFALKVQEVMAKGMDDGLVGAYAVVFQHPEHGYSTSFTNLVDEQELPQFLSDAAEDSREQLGNGEARICVKGTRVLQ